MMPRISRLPANQLGRDFMIGDLHGCLGELQDKLHQSGFNPAAGDRLFSVGDLVDRGPDSFGCLQLLREPWFYSVLGNHDQMLLDAIADPGAGRSQSFLFHSLNGGEWAAEMILQQDPALLALAELVNALPHILVVGAGESRFNVVHAQLLANLDPLQQYRDADLDQERWGEEDNHSIRLMWSRVLGAEAGWAAMDGLDPSYFPGLSLTYCGHNPVPRPVVVQSHFCIDTGAGYPGNNWVDDCDSGLAMRLTLVERLPDGAHRFW